MLKLYGLHSISRKSDMFKSILVLFRKLLNVNKSYIKNTDIIKYIKFYIPNICTYDNIRL